MEYKRTSIFERKNRKRYFLIVSLIILILLLFFFGIYPVNHRYYELSIAYQIADYLGIAFFLSILIFLIITGIIISIKRQNLNYLKFIKQIVKSLFVMTIIHFALFRPVMSGVVLFVNTNFGGQEKYLLKGIIVGKIEHSGKTCRYELCVKQQGTEKVIMLKTQKSETDKYSLNASFEVVLQKGCFELLYLKN